MRDYQSGMALEAASLNGHLGSVTKLLDNMHMADVNADDAKYGGKTALQAACESGHIEIVAKLLDAGADVSITPASTYGRTALQAAAEGGRSKSPRLTFPNRVDL